MMNAQPIETLSVDDSVERVVGPVREGELLLARDNRECDGRYGVGDYVTRDGTDVHLVVDIDEWGDLGTFRCVKEPAPYEPGDAPWIRLGEDECNLTRRYSPVEWQPSDELRGGHDGTK
jgi:hypothetical protein